MNKSVHPRAVILLIYIPTIAPPRNFYQGELIYRCKAAARRESIPKPYPRTSRFMEIDFPQTMRWSRCLMLMWKKNIFLAF